MTNLNDRCALKLKLLRELHNYTQAFVAKSLNISQNAYSMIENGATNITLEKLEKLAEMYKISPEELISQNAVEISNNDGVARFRSASTVPALSTFEKKMYETTISRLEVDIERLYDLLNKITTSKT